MFFADSEFDKSARAACACALLFAFALATHLVRMDLRTNILLGWAYFAIPASTVPVMCGGKYTVVGLTALLVSHWFGLAYSGDMGGSYAHGLGAAHVILTAFVSTVIIVLIFCIRGFRALAYPQRSRTPESKLPEFVNPEPSGPAGSTCKGEE